MKRNVEARRARKAQILGDSNVSESFRSNSSDEEVIKRNRLVQRRKSVIEMEKQQQRLQEEEEAENNGNRKRKSDVSGMDQSGEENGGHSSDSENNAKVQKAKRIRRRLSKRVDDLQKMNRSANAADLNLSYGNLNVSSSHSGPSTPGRPATDKKTLQEIYSTCSALFQAHKITPQNAFSLKLVECLDEIIESDDFDRRNLPLLARTLEIGGKIYVCRVDHTHAHTIKLATEIAQNQNEQAEGPEGEGPHDENEDPNQAEGQEERKKKARTKKRSRFIEENESKLNTGFEDQSSKYATRRASLKLKLHRNIDEELDFDYLSYFLKPGESNPLEREEELRGLSSEAIIPESHANADEMKEIPWLPFHSLTEWDPSKFDFWGVPLSTDPMDISDLQRPFEPPAVEAADENEFAYNPENRPDEYPVENDADSFGGHDGGDFGDDNFNDGPVRPDGVGPLALDNLRSLDDLHKFFASLKGNQMSMKNKYGWAGPVFLKPQRTVLKKHTDGKSKKQPRKKKMILLDFDEVDWKDPANRYIDGGLSKTTIDDKTLDKWATSKTTAPFCNPLNFMNYDEDEEEFRAPFDLPDGTDDFMANVTRFFVDSNKTIFKLMEEEFKMGKDVLSQSHMGPGGMAEQFDDDLPEPDMEIEAARDFADDSNGDIMPVPDAEPGPGLFDDFAAAGFNFSSMFPGSQGFDTDAFSKASEFDSVKFSKQPKPIDMHALKRFIRVILAEKLEIGDEGKPLREEETRMDLLTLITELMKRVNKRMAKHLSVAIVVVGLMHVVHDNKLFMVKDTHTDSPYIVCRGSLWKHKDNIPLGPSEDFYQ